jgi:tetratricopeptide (TPR) repeat protein
MTRPLPLLLALCLTLLAVVRVAHAEDPDMRAAKRHYDRGQKLFALQKFDEALDQFQQAFDAKPIPDFLFNIGQCHRNLGDYDAAIFSFKRFLKLDPEATNREQVEELIAELEEKKTTDDSKKFGFKKPPREKPPESEGRPVYKKWWFWTGVAVVGVAGGVGIYTLTRPGAPDTSLGNFGFEK